MPPGEDIHKGTVSRVTTTAMPPGDDILKGTVSRLQQCHQAMIF